MHAHFIYKWIIASRPWTFTASIMPIILGSILPYTRPQYIAFDFFKVSLFLLTVFAGVSLQAAANFFNTYGDYVSGVDSKASAFSCPELVTQTMKPESIQLAGTIMVLLAFFIGTILSLLCGWYIFLFGIIGLAGAFFYTMGWYPYKYIGLGLPFVFFLMGPLMVMPSYYIQSGKIDIYSLWVSIPIAFLVTAIMHANDLRDINYDRDAGIYTVALSLGLKYSIILYFIFCLSAFLSTFLLVFTGLLPVTVLIVIFLLPLLWIKFKKLTSSSAPKEIQNLVVWSAFFHLWFSIFFIVGIVVHQIV